MMYKISSILPLLGALLSTFAGVSPVHAAVPGELAKTWTHAESLGNTTFGAGYTSHSGLTLAPGRGLGEDRVEAGSHVSAQATLFGTRHDVIRIQGKAARTPSQDSSWVNINVMGLDVWSKAQAGDLSQTISLDVPFFTATTVIPVGPIPVIVSGEATGEAGFIWDSTFGATSSSTSFAPFARAYAAVSAALGIPLLATVGVEGALTLVEADAPMTTTVGLGAARIDWAFDQSVVVKSLSGAVTAFAKLLWYKWTVDLFSWAAPLTHTTPIASETGSLPRPLVID